MKFQLKNNSYLLMLMMLLAFVGDALSAERGADRPGGGSAAAAAAAGAEEIEEVEEPIFTLLSTTTTTIRDRVRVIFSPDGSKLVTVRPRGLIQLWNVEDGDKVRELDHGEKVSLVKFSPDGSRLVTTSVKTTSVTASEGTLKLWNVVGDGELIKELVTPWKFEDVAFSSDSSYLATISELGVTNIWNAENGGLVREVGLIVAQPISVAFSPDGKLVTVERDKGGTAKIWNWNIEDREIIQEFNYLQGKPVILSPNGSKLAMVSQDAVIIWNVNDHKMIKALGFLRSPSVAFNSDNDLVMVFKIRNKIRIEILNAENGEVIKGFNLDQGGGRDSIVLSPDGRILVIIPDDGSAAVVYNVENGKVIKKLPYDGLWVARAEFSYNGSQLLMVLTGGTVYVWRIRSGRLTKPAIAKKSIEDTPEGKFLQSQITAALSKDGAQQIKDHYENLKKAIENNEVENKMPKAFDDLYVSALQFLKDEEC